MVVMMLAWCEVGSWWGGTKINEYSNMQGTVVSNVVLMSVDWLEGRPIPASIPNGPLHPPTSLSPVHCEVQRNCHALLGDSAWQQPMK